jgi:hypothetical protein
MKWYKPIQASKELEEKIGLIAIIAITGLAVAILAILMALGDK